MRHESIAPKIEGCSELFSHITTIGPSMINNQAGLRMARAARASRMPSSEHVAANTVSYVDCLYAELQTSQFEGTNKLFTLDWSFI